MVNKIAWNKINLTLKTHGSDRALLKDLGGEVSAGQMLAIMGPTGCGKTSLLNVLAGRIVKSKELRLFGNVFYDEEFINDISLSDKAVYVSQDDILFSYLTVRETLALAAYFYSPVGTNQQEIDRKVQLALQEMSLSKSADTIIGSYTRRGVSGGEYKRVLIGKELMKSPSVIFLDEPTSGLDSYQAFSVMCAMKTLAINGRIVVSVIHQPRSAIYLLFDRLLLLSEGQTMYFGPARDTVDYFARLGHVCPQHFNPADFFLDVLSLNLKTKEAEEETRARLEFFSKEWVQYALTHVNYANGASKKTVENGEESKESTNGAHGMSICGSESQFSDILELSPASAIPAWSDPNLTLSQAVRRWFVDFGAVCRRTFAEIHRNYAYLVIRTITVLFFSVLLSLIYQNIGYGQRNIRDRYGLQYFVLINQAFTPFYNVLNVFPVEKKIVSREIWSGAYKTSSYYMARVVCELPVQFVLPILYSSIVYWSAGLNPLYDRFLLFLVIVVMTTFVAISIGFCVSAIAPSAIIANAVGPPLIIVMLLFGGFYINEASLPTGSGWVVNLSLMYWGFQALVINEFEGEHFYCTASDPSCVTHGEQVVDNLSFEDGSIVVSCIALAALFVGFTTLGYLGLLLNREKYMMITAVPAVPQPALHTCEHDEKEEVSPNSGGMRRGEERKEQELVHSISMGHFYG